MIDISTKTRLFAVLGHPITHSLSPQMQNAALRKMGLDAVYLAFDVAPERLLESLKVMAELGFAGVNLTVPLKEVAFRGLKNLDSSAKILGSVNTVRFLANEVICDGKGGPAAPRAGISSLKSVATERDGHRITDPSCRMKGYSTDGPGFLLALKKVFRASPKGKSVFLLGCGGAGRAVALTCAQAGAAKISLCDVDLIRAEKLRKNICALNKKTAVEIVGSDRAERNDSAWNVDLIIQASPVGMRRGDPVLLDPEAFRKGQMVYDLIYMFPETRLMRIARKQGALAANGLDMLAFQGALSLEIWTGRKAPVEVMRKTLEKAVYGRRS